MSEILGINITKSETDSMPLCSSVVKVKTTAPRALTSFTLLTIFSNKVSFVARATTSVFSSIKEIVPCFNSPAGYASEWMYEISFNFSDPSRETA